MVIIKLGRQLIYCQNYSPSLQNKHLNDLPHINQSQENKFHLVFFSLNICRPSWQYSFTYVDLLPLADVADEARQPQQPDEREELGEAQDAQRAARVQDLEALRVLLRKKGEREMEKSCNGQSLTLMPGEGFSFHFPH